MSKQQKTQKLELATLDANNIQELDGWKAKQETIIKENPFIEIVDRETYEIAKSRRTALVSARTEIQKQDKTIGSFLSKFRKQTMEIAKDLIAITEPHEEKQQSEVARYEEILEAKRQEKELSEQKRVEGIQEKINEFKRALSGFVQNMTFEKIEVTERLIEDHILSRSGFNYEEFEPMFDEVVSDYREEFKNEVARLKHAENVRLEQLKRDQEAEMNRRSVFAQSLIDSLTDPDDLISSIEKTFEKEFYFGEYQNQLNENYRSYLVKAEEKIKSINAEIERRKEIKTQENINRINNVREGLLDKIFQMTADDYELDLKYVQDALNQTNPFPELEEKFMTMIETVKKNLDSKMKMINAELEQRKQEAIDARIAIDARTAQRGKQLEEIGFTKIEQKTENYWSTLSIEIEVFESIVEGLSDEDWTTYIEGLRQEIDQANEKNKAFQERQKRLKQDKEEMIKTLNDYILKMPKGLKNEESIQLFSEIQKSFNLFRESKIETINKF